MGKQKGHIVIADDDVEMRSLLSDFFVSDGYKVSAFPLAKTALDFIVMGHKDDVDLIISDLRMPEMDGIAFSKKLHEFHVEVPVVLITAYGSIETAVHAMRSGIYDFVVKPFKLGEIQVIVERAVEYRKLRQENVVLRKEVRRTWSLGELVGKSREMQTVFDLVTRVAVSSANVLITGESGTGKEMVARAIHNLSPRASRPFIAINCTAIPDTLLESELFGHARGAFTGAIQRKRGLFEEAIGGTLFLDEIGDMDLALQAKLLRVIQEKKIRALGENVFKDIDVRIVAATHKDLKTAIKDSRFREDLFYRLSVIPINIPPLRHRKDDIPVLAEHFLRKYAASNGVRIQGFTDKAMARLLNLKWEGNVRELENLIERAVVLCQAGVIDCDEIPEPTDAHAEEFFGSATRDFPTVDQLEKRYIQLILDKTGYRKSKAAQILGINRRTLYRKQREYGLETGVGDEPEADWSATEQDGPVV